ncbi:Cell division and transport-associated protein TolR [Arboricoccus pini]|uniref:Cell division and transport-associated protein TolR n=1 Tax=Arboricoccus pini TaxID=1963835 RepID=A0A212R7W8_9PROT|nr:biopolymer transporter ExbD [Arboricoccus pini]SNB68252.1 Cell division and transport-associated protein TolR [Arboricoccus pini]
MAIGPLIDGGDEEGFRPLAEINVTPLVDVMLVLLIVFMVSAPLMMAGVKIDLPKTSAATISPPKEPVVLTIDRQGRLFIKQDEIATADLASRLDAMAKGDKGQVIYIRGDRELPYGKIMAVMSDVSQAGFASVSLVGESRPNASEGAALPAAGKDQP